MLFTILLMAFLGVALGVFTGITPGIHTNLLATSMLIVTENIESDILTPLNISVVIFSMALTNNFISFIPSTFLGVPEAETVMSMLPSHEYMLKGKAHEAVLLTLMGSLTAVILTILLTPFFIIAIKMMHYFLKAYIPIILILIAATLIIREKSKFFAIYVFIASGILGIYSLNTPLIKNPLLPLLTGLFGFPSLIMSVFNNAKPAMQQISFPAIKGRAFIKAIATSIATGSIFSFLPSVGPSQAAVFSSLITKEKSKDAFLIILGSLNTVNMIISIITMYAISKARNGAIVAISSIVPKIDATAMLIFIGVTLMISYPITLLTIVISKGCIRVIKKIRYDLMSISIVMLLVLLSLIISGFYSILVLVTATAIGFLPILKNTNRNHLMGCLMLSTIMFYIL